MAWRFALMIDPAASHDDRTDFTDTFTIIDPTAPALNVSELDALYGRLEKRLSPATIRHVHVAIKAALSVAVDKGHLRANPAARASVPRAIEPDCGQALAADELRRLLDGFRG